MAGIADFKHQIQFIVQESQWKPNSPAACTVLGGVWELTSKDHKLGARVATNIVDELRSGRYSEQTGHIYRLIMRGWFTTEDEELEDRLANYFRSPTGSDALDHNLAKVFSDFLKEFGPQESTYKHSDEHQLNSYVQYSKKLARFVAGAAPHTRSECVRIAGREYMRHATAASIRALFAK